jgi:ribonuclease HI
MVLQWIPSHCGIQGNEEADKIAKQGAKKNHKQTTLSASQK